MERPVGVKVIVVACDRTQGAVHHGAAEHIVNTRNARYDVIAEARLMFEGIPNQSIDLGMCRWVDVGGEFDETVRNKLTYRLVIKELWIIHSWIITPPAGTLPCATICVG